MPGLRRSFDVTRQAAASSLAEYDSDVLPTEQCPHQRVSAVPLFHCCQRVRGRVARLTAFLCRRIQLEKLRRFRQGLSDQTSSRGCFSSPRYPYPLTAGFHLPTAPPIRLAPVLHWPMSTTRLNGWLTSRHGYAVPDAVAAWGWWRTICADQRIRGEDRGLSHTPPLSWGADQPVESIAVQRRH